MQKIKAFLQLMRFDRPIGIFLLLWPIEWGLWIAAHGLPQKLLFFIFTAGVVIMRAAGCIINDLADQRFDGHVKRTQQRPLITGSVKPRAAFILFSVLCLMGLGLVLLLNRFTLYLAILALGLSVLYPFMKRFIYFPQLILGIAWYIGILMTFSATQGHLSLNAWLLYLSGILWVLAYDTMYAMADRVEDLKIGVKSTAILFGTYDRLMVGIFQILTLSVLMLIGMLNHLAFSFYLGLAVAGLFFIYQQWLIRTREPRACLNAFLNNHWVGLSVFVGLFFSYR